MSITKKILNKVVLKVLLSRGYSYTTADIVLKRIDKDITFTKDMSIFRRIYWYRKGFLAGTGLRIEKSIDKDYFVPELKYYKLHPINGFYSQWIDDKLTMRYVLAPFKEFLPEYYYQLSSKAVIALPDLEERFSPDIHGLLDLLNEVGTLAVKQFTGSGGEGFIKLECMDGYYKWNGRILSQEELTSKLLTFDNMIVTEFAKPSELLNNLNPFSSSNIRIVVTNKNGDFKVLMTYLLIGTKKSQNVSNISMGGGFARINKDNGNILAPAVFSIDDKRLLFDKHPDTKLPIQGTIENWDAMLKTLSEISTYLPELKYLGYDIVTTTNGYKILEINSLQAFINSESLFGDKPSKETLEFFKNLLH